MNSVPIAVVGLGNFGSLHAQTIAALAETELVGLVDSRQEVVDRVRAIFPSVPGWTSLEQAIVECDAKGWVVASSTASHVANARTILSAGRHVLLEKPLATSLVDAESLSSLVADDSSNLLLGHIVLFNSEFRSLCREARRRGPLSFIDGVRHRPNSTMEAFPGESPLHLTMIHDLYCLLALMQGAEPDCFDAMLHRASSGACDLAIAHLRWPSGTVASLTASFLTPPGMPPDGFDRLEVFGEGWAARIQPNPRPLELWDSQAQWPLALEIGTGESAATGMLAEELRTFSRAVCGAEPVPIGARYCDGLQILRWLEQLQAVAAER